MGVMHCIAILREAIGNDNVAIGANAGGGNYNDAISIGYFANASDNNRVRIGDGVTSIGGPAAWTNTSDARFKENVKNNVIGLDFVLGLEPVTYNINYKAINRHQLGTDTIHSQEHYQDLYNTTNIGFLAQDVEALADSLNFDFHGVDKPESPEGIYGLRYAEFVPSLVKAVQEQQKLIEQLQKELTELKK